MASWWRSYIAHGARARGLDPAAVLAVAGVEGLSGRPGDQNTSWGPFQLHVGGALPAGRGRAWAESPAGINYALDQIAKVARGLHGHQAVAAIVSRFERPANVAGEIARASGGGGGVGGAGGIEAAVGAPAPPSLPGGRAQLLASLISASQQTARHQQPDYSQVFAGLAALRGGGGGQAAAPAVMPSGPGAPIRGGSSLRFLEPLANRFGLAITSTTGGQHVHDSYHYQGRAVDYSGNPQREAALQRYALNHPGQFVEAFYTGPGAAPYYVKNGHVYPIAQLDPSVRAGHRTHVHLAR